VSSTNVNGESQSTDQTRKKAFTTSAAVTTLHQVLSPSATGSLLRHKYLSQNDVGKLMYHLLTMFQVLASMATATPSMSSYE
jgi:hypothetical protein